MAPVHILFTESTKKFVFRSRGASSVGETFTGQAWGPEFNPQAPLWGEEPDTVVLGKLGWKVPWSWLTSKPLTELQWREREKNQQTKTNNNKTTWGQPLLTPHKCPHTHANTYTLNHTYLKWDLSLSGMLGYRETSSFLDFFFLIDTLIACSKFLHSGLPPSSGMFTDNQDPSAKLRQVYHPADVIQTRPGGCGSRALLSVLNLPPPL